MNFDEKVAILWAEMQTHKQLALDLNQDPRLREYHREKAGEYRAAVWHALVSRDAHVVHS